MIAVDELTVSAGRTRIVDGVSFSAEPGEWVSLLGPNGAGKSTIVRALAGVAGYEGSARVGGREVAELGRRVARSVAYVPQQPVVPHDMTVAEYVLLGRTAHISTFAQEGEEDREAAERALVRLGLEGFTTRRLGSLSGGELQRALIARALAQEAPVLLLDEPTTALDIGHQQEVLELVEELRADSPLTVLTTMHDLTLAAQYGDRIVLLSGGRVVGEGAPADVLSEERIAALYGAAVRVLVDESGLVGVVPVRP